MRQFNYQQEVTGVEIVLLCPWEAQSGLIPPPVIEFYDSNIRTQMPFKYTGENSGV